MPRVAFDRLPRNARLWIFSAERELTDSEGSRLLEEVDVFIDQWTAHGVQLTAGRDWQYSRFLFVGVDEAAAGVSGCSIDSLVRRMKVLQEMLGAELVNQAPVFFRTGSMIERVSRERFAELANSGMVTTNTAVFDNTLTKVGDIYAGRWEVSVSESWHAKAFFDE